MIFTCAHLAKATTTFESLFRLACLSVDFNPTIVVASNSQFLIANTYRGMVIKGHFLGAATTGSDALALVAQLKPNIIALSDDLPDQTSTGLITQARQINPDIRSILFVTRMNLFADCVDSPIVLAESDLLKYPNTLTLACMALTRNTPYRSPSIHERLRKIEQYAPDFHLGNLVLTRREHQLLEAYALGLSNEETAKKLGLSVRSIQTYSGTLLKKLGTNNRQRALMRAKSLGLTKPSHVSTKV